MTHLLFFTMKFRAIALTVVIAVVPVSALPALSQETEIDAELPTEMSEEDPKAQIAQTIAGNVDPAAAITQAVTIDNPTIPIDQLELRVKPLTLEELYVEAAAWFILLKDKAERISAEEILIRRENQAIQDEQRAIKKLKEAETKLSKAESALVRATPNTPRYERAEQQQQEAQQLLRQAEQDVTAAIRVIRDLEADQRTQQLLQDARAEVPTEDVEDSEATLAEIDATLKALEAQIGEEERETASDDSSAQEIAAAARQLEALAEAQANVKKQLVVDVIELQGEETAIIDRFKVVLDAVDSKDGDTTAYRKYIEVVSTLDLDLSDAEGLGLRVMTWLRSEEGGKRWGLNVAKFIGILLASLVLAQVLSAVTYLLLKRSSKVSSLFRTFLTMAVRRGVMIGGAMVALTSLGVNLGPILALVGGASFVLAFALQSNLGNFASGLMLMLTKPFDVGDEVKLAGYWAYVDSISLASTSIKDFNGNRVTLPNNVVWGGDIVNYTHSEQRRLAFSLHIKFEQDIDQLKALWFEITAAHPDVLKTPSPTIFPWNAHYDYYIQVALKAWCPTKVYWTVYADLLKKLQHGLLDLGIELATPKQDVRLYQDSAELSGSYGNGRWVTS